MTLLTSANVLPRLRLIGVRFYNDAVPTALRNRTDSRLAENLGAWGGGGDVARPAGIAVRGVASIHQHQHGGLLD